MQIGQMELLFKRIKRSECVNELCLISLMVMLHINISITLPPILQVGNIHDTDWLVHGQSPLPLVKRDPSIKKERK